MNKKKTKKQTKKQTTLIRTKMSFFFEDRSFERNSFNNLPVVLDKIIIMMQEIKMLHYTCMLTL